MYDCKKPRCNKTYETEEEAINCCKEVITKIEEIKGVNFHKDLNFISFVIKPLHIDQANRWAKWCNDRGFKQHHHKAFALAMDILEGKTQDIINSSKNLEKLERLVKAHDELLSIIVKKLNDEQTQDTFEEETDPNVLARQKVSEQKEKRRLAKEAEEERKKEDRK